MPRDRNAFDRETPAPNLEARAHPLGVGGVQRVDVAPHVLVARR